MRYGVDIGASIAPVGNTNKVWEDKKVEELIDRVVKAAKIGS
jgi:N-acetylneuraminate lyase